MLGFLNINKPQGLTSHDCVARVRKILGIKRIGHSGTLDPMAVGVLPIAVNQATRLLPYLQGGKAYKAVIKFGLVTTTDDREGETIADQPCPHLTLEQIKEHLPQFIGTIEQVPPQFSAIKVEGKKLYDLARSGIAIALPPRPVTIASIEVLQWQPSTYPELTLVIDCGTGTYIRSIARDLGHILGCGGMLAALERTSSNGFAIEQSIPLEAVSPERIMPADRALAHLSSIDLEPEQARRWQQGQKIPLEHLSDQNLRVYQGEKFLGVGKAEDHFLQPQVVLPD